MAAFFAGALLSSMLLGILLGLLGLIAIFSNVTLWILILAVLLFVIVRVSSLDIRAPTSGWVVPRHWRAVGWVRWSFLFGFLLGFGFLTAVPTGCYYIVILSAVALGDPASATCVLATFGATRCLPLLVVSRCLRAPSTIPGSQSTVRCLARLSPHRRRVAAVQPTLASLVLGLMV